jgi:hypothetical protein
VAAVTPETRRFEPAGLRRLLDGRTVTFVAGQAVETVIERLFARQIAQVIFRAVQDHAVNAARAHMATVLLAAFQRAVAGCEDEGLRSALNLLCDLYAPADLESDRAYFTEYGRLSGPRCKGITREVNRLCNEARLCAAELVDAFGIPDEVLAAPIGVEHAAKAA